MICLYCFSFEVVVLVDNSQCVSTFKCLKEKGKKKKNASLDGEKHDGVEFFWPFKWKPWL